MSATQDDHPIEEALNTTGTVRPWAEPVGGFALIDTDRLRRTGLPEAIYSPSKTLEQVVEIFGHQLDQDGPVIATRCSFELASAITSSFDKVRVFPDLNRSSPYFTCVSHANPPGEYDVGLITAGTSDLAVAHEAEATLFAMGTPTDLICDVGVAGIYRLLDKIETIRKFDALIVMAGMEASLASVLGGLVTAPIVAVPTSTGYGSSLEGITATLSMLASCAPGISIVGIDNGFGAACSVSKLFGLLSRKMSGQ